MNIYIRIIFICVSIYIYISGADHQTRFIDLDISRISQDFYKICYKNYDKIFLNTNISPLSKCVGKITDGSSDILGLPDPSATSRTVRVLKVPKNSDYNPELEQAFLKPSLEPSQAIDSDFESIVEVYTVYGNTILHDRFKKLDDNTYEEFDYEKVELDICNDFDNVLKIGDLNVLNIANFKTFGIIKCKDFVLLDEFNVFYRTVRIEGSLVVVKTVPKFGLVNQQKYYVDDSKEYAVLQRTTRSQAILDLANTRNTFKISSSCGNDCVFYDGCNEKLTLVGVSDGSQNVYFNRNTFCLSVKVENLSGDLYVTIFDFPKNSNSTNVKTLKRSENVYSEHVKTHIDLNLSDLNDPKPIELIYKNLLNFEHLSGKLRVRVFDVGYRIGKIYFNDAVVMAEREGVLNREVYVSPEGIMVRDEQYDGEFRKYLFSLQESEENVQCLKPSVESGVKVDLHTVSEHVVKYFTDSNNHLFVKPTTFLEKLGTLSYDLVAFCPNRFFVSRQYLIMNDHELKLHSVNKKGFSFYDSFVMVHSLKKNDQVFVSRSKDPLGFDLSHFYFSLSQRKLSVFNKFDIVNLGNYYLVGVSYKLLYSRVVGNISISGKVFAPFDMDLAARFVVLPKSSQSHVILKDCDYSDCWLKLYKQTSQMGMLGMEIQGKEPQDLDLEKLFQSDSGGEKVFKFEKFIVFDYGAVWNVRVSDELREKIGKVVYGSKVIEEDCEGIFSRMVNVSVKRSNGSLRVLDIERWHKSTRLYSFTVDDGFAFERRQKSDLVVDIDPLERTNPLINVSERDDVLSFSVPWNSRDDHHLSKITYSEYNYDSEQFEAKTVKEDLDKRPPFVRVHRDGEGGSSGKYVLVVEGHGSEERPKDGEFFKLKNAVKGGIIWKYDVNDNSVEDLNEYRKDTYHRRVYSSHLHEFSNENQ